MLFLLFTLKLGSIQQEDATHKNQYNNGYQAHSAS